MPPQNMLAVSKFSTGNVPWAMLTPELCPSVGWEHAGCHKLNYKDNAMAVMWTSAILHPGLSKFTSADTADEHS